MTLARLDAEATKRERRIRAPDPLHEGALHEAHGDVCTGSHGGDLDPLGIDERAVSDAEGRRVVGSRDVEGVLDRPGLKERPPVMLLQRAPHPFGGHEHDIRPRIREQAGDLGKAEVVTGLQRERQPVPGEGLGSCDLAGFDQSDSRCPKAS